MAANNSLVFGIEDFYRKVEQVIILQVLVSLFLCINFMLLTTFFMKDYFYTTMRYILFANALLSDCMALIVTDLLLIFNQFHISMQLWICFILFALSSIYTFVTPVTLTAMALERCVAICMPFRHAELCSTRHALHCVLIIHGLSSVPFIVIFLSSVKISVFKPYKVCHVETFILNSKQRNVRSAISQIYFLLMFSIIIFSYVKIMKVAKIASGENKKSTLKGLRTVVLHASQLLLCLIQLLCPLIEAAALKIDLKLFVNIRYFNYMMFYFFPRCLSPLIYGLRDEKFFLALKYCVLCGLVKNKSCRMTHLNYYSVTKTTVKCK